jgi:hypothetical protein
LPDLSTQFSTELSQVYKNPFLKGEKAPITKPSEEFKMLDFNSFKFRSQSSPPRQIAEVNKLWSGSREESVVHVRSRDEAGSLINESVNNKYKDIEKLVKEVEI